MGVREKVNWRKLVENYNETHTPKIRNTDKTNTQFRTNSARLTTIAWKDQNLTNSSFSSRMNNTGTTKVGPKSVAKAADVSFLSPVAINNHLQSEDKNGKVS